MKTSNPIEAPHTLKGGAMRIAIISLLLFVFACAGDQGPAGPTGPQGATGTQGLPGPAGADGAVNRVEVSGISNGTIWPGAALTLALPAVVGTDPTKPPAVAAYITSNPSSGLWLAIADGFDSNPAATTYFRLRFLNGVWNVEFINLPSLWSGTAIVFY